VKDHLNIDNNFKTCDTDDLDKHAKDDLEYEQCVENAGDDNYDKQANEDYVVPKHISKNEYNDCLERLTQFAL
jgi:hypothetical protein